MLRRLQPRRGVDQIEEIVEIDLPSDVDERNAEAIAKAIVEQAIDTIVGKQESNKKVSFYFFFFFFLMT